MPLSERDFKAKLREAILKLLPRATVFSHNDAITGNVPDMSVSFRMTTLWIEAKVSTNLAVNRAQDEQLRRLDGVKLVYDVNTGGVTSYAFEGHQHIASIDEAAVRIVNTVLAIVAAGAAGRKLIQFAAEDQISRGPAN